MRKCLLVCVLVLFGQQCGFADTIETESKVIAATVYTNSAQVTRAAQVDLKEGLHELVFTNVPEHLNENTLTVSAKGTARAKILDARIKKVFLEEAQSELVRKLEDEIQDLDDQVVALNNEQATIREKREFLRSINLHAAEQVPEDLITKTPDVQQLQALAAFIQEQWQETYQRELQIKQELREINKTLDRLRRELAQLRQATGKEKRVASIELDVEKAGALDVSVSYLMYQASWYPEYDARVDYEGQGVDLVCLGVVKQTSGEDWQDIQISLSTAKPTVSGRMPELQSWIIRPTPPLQARAKMSWAPAMDAAKLQEGVNMEYAARGAMQEKAERSAEEATLAYAQAQEQLTSVTYQITHTAAIKADGTKHRLPIFEEKLKTDFFYSATPKLSPFAYLVAKVTNERESLLPAGVRIFLGDTYVGSSSIDAVGKGEEFELYLGIDEGVKVEREKTEEETKEVWIAGIKRNNKVLKATYKISVENYKGKDIRVNVFDHMPVSQSDNIVVKVLETRPKAAEEDYEDRKGVTCWELDVAPREEKEISYTYQIEYPRDMDIGL